MAQFRKPVDFSIRGNFKAQCCPPETLVIDDEDVPVGKIVFVQYEEISAAECRRLAKWLIKAADWKDSK